MSLPVVNDSERTFAPFRSELIKLPLKDIDTDMIIPAEFLKTTTRSGLGEHVFSTLRANDPDFPVFDGRRILLAGPNFGCGSSREHAVWALKQAGVDVVISTEFADIFQGNARKNNLLTIALDSAVMKTLWEDHSLEIDLPQRTIERSSGEKIIFDYPDFSARCLLEGITDLDYLQDFEPQIAAYHQKHPETLFPTAA